jgi:hypothetical protein
MLKPPEPGEAPNEERPVGELVHQLVEEGKAYAQAEIAVVKAIASAKLRALAVPGGLFFGAMLFAQAAVTVLAVGVFFTLSLAVNPILAGLIALVIFGAIAGGLAWYAIKRLQRDL